MSMHSTRAPAAAQGWWGGVVAALALAVVPTAMAAGDTRTLVVSAQPAAHKEQRLALVIGNNAYADAPLVNPVNDARAMAAALEKSGFTVLLRTDVTQRDMLAAVREFGSRLREGGSGVFYFAGHGMQIKGRNYLIPVGADIQREDEVAYQAMDAQAVLDKMETAGNGTNLMILDAGRNNPFARSFRSAQQGLAQMDAPVGTLVAFATSPGSVSSDGSGRHGLYTEYLLRSMAQPGVKVEDVFKQVRVGVRRDSQGKQIPWESTSLEGDFYFLAPVVVQAPPPPAPALSVSPEVAMEQALWEAVRDSTQLLDLQAYLRRFPQGAHAPQVRERVVSLTPAPTTAQLALPAFSRPAIGKPLAAGAPVPVLPPLVAAGPRIPAASPAVVPAPAPAPAPVMAQLELPALLRPAPGVPLARVSPATSLPTPVAAAVRVPPMPPSAVPVAIAVQPDHGPARTLSAEGFSTGDRWRFQVVDKWKGEVVRNYTAQIDRIEQDGQLLLQSGSRLDALGRPLLVVNKAAGARTRYSAAPIWWWEAMQPGQKRSQVWRQVRTEDEGRVTTMDVDARMVVKAQESIRVPAGEFKALRIEVDASVEGQTNPGGRWWNRWVQTYWYVPEMRYFVAADYEVLDAARGTRLSRERHELTSYEQRMGPLAAR